MNWRAGKHEDHGTPCCCCPSLACLLVRLDVCPTVSHWLAVYSTVQTSSEVMLCLSGCASIGNCLLQSCRGCVHCDFRKANIVPEP